MDNDILLRIRDEYYILETHKDGFRIRIYSDDCGVVFAEPDKPDESGDYNVSVWSDGRWSY